MLNRERCSPTIIIERSIKIFIILIFSIFIEVASVYEEGDMDDLGTGVGIIIGIIAAIALLILFINWLSWLNTYVSAVDDNLIYESGVFVKKKVSIPFSKINTIDVGRNVFQRIVGTETLKIDTGAIAENTDEKSEMGLIFSVKRGEEIRDYIISRSSQDEKILRDAGQSPIIEHGEPKWAIKAGFGDFFLYGLTSSSVLKAFGYILLIFTFVAQLSDAILDKIMDAADPIIDSTMGFFASHGILFLILLAIVLIFIFAVISNIINILWATLRYFNFRVARDGDNIVIKYGLISLKSYTLPVRNIHAVTTTQNLFQQLLKKTSVSVTSIGYGNEQNETALLFPIISLENAGLLINEILPEYSGAVELKYSGKKGVRFNVVIPMIIWGVVLASAAVILSVIFENLALALTLPIILYALIAFGYILEHKHTAIGYNDRAIDVQSGGYRKTRTHIRLDAVQSVSTTAGIFKRRRNLANFVVAYHAPAMQQAVMAKSFDTSYLEEIAKIIEE